MIKGLFFSESGEVQQIGEITNLSSIISALEAVLPQLKEEHVKSILSKFTEEDLMRAISQRKADQKNEEKSPAKVA